MYFLRRNYLGKSSSDEIGRWTVEAGTRTLQLQSGEKVSERLDVTDATTLSLLDRGGHPIDSKLNYALKRQATFAPIEPHLDLRGMYSYMADSGIFTECLSSKRLTVAQEGDNAALEKAYSSARPRPGTALLATVAGRIAMRAPMEGQGSRPTLVVDRFHSVTAGPCSGAGSTVSIEEKYWKLIRLGDEPVKVTEPLPEPHIILHSDTKRVSGSGGCNRLMGSYVLDGQRLTFGQLAGTMMACPASMEQEQQFVAALGRVASWRLTNEHLALLDASGALIAQFEFRHMQ